MNESTALSIFSWLGEHPVLSGLVIFLVALTESLAVVGILVPGIVLMLIIGAYLATDQFSFSIAIILTISGAIFGDGISYYLGYRYKDKLISIWPISRYPDTFNKGVTFFERHGYKSIFFGRFIGPLRAFIPAIAGMFQMPKKQFFISNILSAIVWAPLVLLPGYAIGLSIEFASDIAGRLIIMVMLIGTLLWLTFSIFKIIYLFIAPRFDLTLVFLLNWIHRSDKTKYSDINVFVLLFLINVSLFCLFFVIPSYFKIINITTDIDIIIKNLVLTLNSPATNQLITVIIKLINFYWVLILSALILLLLFWQKHANLFRYYLFSVILIGIIQIVLNIHFKIDHNYNLFAISNYLFLTFILSYNKNRKLKIIYYGICYSIITTTMIAQLYQGSTNLIAILLNNCFSLIWVVIISNTYKIHSDLNNFSFTFKNKTALFFFITLVINLWLIQTGTTVKTFKPAVYIVENSIWQNYLWSQLVSIRKGFIKNIQHSFNIQFIGNKSQITSRLVSHSNWSRSRNPKISDIIQSLNPQAKINSLAIYPHLHNGTYEQLRFIQHTDNGILVLRLWKTTFKIKNFNTEQKDKPLWQGTLTKLVVEKRLGVQFLQSESIDIKQLNKIRQKYFSDKLYATINYNNSNNISVLILSAEENN